MDGMKSAEGSFQDYFLPYWRKSKPNVENSTNYSKSLGENEGPSFAGCWCVILTICDAVQRNHWMLRIPKTEISSPTTFLPKKTWARHVTKISQILATKLDEGISNI